jgi:hypothetical protein
VHGEVDHDGGWFDHSPQQRNAAMAWYDRFGKYRNAEELRWIVFILAAITGLLIILLTVGLG